MIGSLNHGSDEWNDQHRPTYEWVIDLLRSGRLRADGLITHRFPFEQYRQAVATYQDKAGSKAIKVIFSYA